MVWDALVNQARLQPNNGLKNKRILVVDAGSPTGCIAIQVCTFLLCLLFMYYQVNDPYV